MKRDDGHPHREPDPTGSDRPAEPAITVRAGMPRCPQCGGNRIRQPTRPLAINAVACVVTLALTPAICAMVLAVVVSFLTLPFTACIAAVGRSRCLDCRYRFKPAPEDSGVADPTSFPWMPHILNGVLLFLLCMVVPKIMRVRAGAGTLPELTADMGRLITCGVFLWVSLGFHLAIYSRLKQRATSPLLWMALFLLPGVSVGGLVCYTSRPSLHMRAFLEYAQLAPLPQSATGVRFYSWSSPFSGEDFVRFTAEPNGIEQFLAESPALQGQEPERFSATRMRLAYPKGDQANSIYLRDDGHVYIVPRRNVPAWYKQEIRGPARKYRLQPPEYQYSGEVLVDDETNTVYIRACFS